MRTFVATALSVLLIAAAPALAQRGKKKPRKQKWRTDPYTKMDEAAMKKAGYLNFGPFPWGDDHSSEMIEQKLGEVRLIWVETPHFRIGSSLAPWQVETKKKKQLRRIRAELGRLAKKIPRLKPKRIKKLDPWLRLHLYAQRLEELYDEFNGRLEKGIGKKKGAAKAPREAAGKKDAPQGEGADMWQGPGMPDKFCVLLLQERTSLERYLSLFLNMKSKYPRRFIFPKNGCPLFVTAASVHPGNLWNDRALNCHVTFNVVHNFVEGFKGNFYQLPVWWGEGLAHWYSRRIDDEFSNYSQPPNVPAEMREHEKWNKIVRGLVKFDNFTEFEQMFAWLSYGKIKFKDHLVAWSRVDFLMARNEKGFGIFLDGIKGQRDAAGATIRGTVVLERQKKAFEKAWKLEPGEFDEKWKAWVVDTYPKK